MNEQSFYDKYKRDPVARKFYKSKAWLKCREKVLDRDNGLCQKCLKEERLTPADMVHHIREFRDYPDLALTESNLMSLCNPCHNTFHSHTGTKRKKKSRKINVVKSKANGESL